MAHMFVNKLERFYKRIRLRVVLDKKLEVSCTVLGEGKEWFTSRSKTIPPQEVAPYWMDISLEHL